jgi:hypothetical protein
LNEKLVKFTFMKKILIWGIVIFILVAGNYVYWKYYFTYSEGYRAGLLQKFSYRGNLFKTYEGEMILSSVESSQNVPLASEKFFFSVNDTKIASKMEELEGHMIVVRYKQKHGKLWWRGETGYMIDSVRLVNDQPGKTDEH